MSLDFHAVAADEIVTNLRARDHDAALLGEFHRPDGEPFTDAEMVEFRAAYDAAVEHVAMALALANVGRGSR